MSTAADRTKLIVYGIVVAGYLVAGAIDLAQGHRKLGVIALIFAAANATIFFWREQ